MQNSTSIKYIYFYFELFIIYLLYQFYKQFKINKTQNRKINIINKQKAVLFHTYIKLGIIGLLYIIMK